MKIFSHEEYFLAIYLLIKMICFFSLKFTYSWQMITISKMFFLPLKFALCVYFSEEIHTGELNVLFFFPILILFRNCLGSLGSRIQQAL